MPLHRSTRKRLRHIVLARDGYICQVSIPGICRSRGRPLPKEELDVDHIIETRAGGTDELTNLRASCKPCNTYRSGGRNGAVTGGKVRL